MIEKLSKVDKICHEPLSYSYFGNQKEESFKRVLVLHGYYLFGHLIFIFRFHTYTTTYDRSLLDKQQTCFPHYTNNGLITTNQINMNIINWAISIREIYHLFSSRNTLIAKIRLKKFLNCDISAFLVHYRFGCQGCHRCQSS